MSITASEPGQQAGGDRVHLGELVAPGEAQQDVVGVGVDLISVEIAERVGADPARRRSTIQAHAREHLEHRCRYLLRPPLTLEKIDGELRGAAPVPVAPPPAPRTCCSIP